MSVKNMKIRAIKSSIANAFVRRWHYSGKVVNNSQLHLGVFWNGRLEGVLSFGPSMRKHFMLGIVKGTKWNEFIELNRMAMSDRMPKNSESRAIAVSIKLIKKYCPKIKWIITFADGCQCGDGTIYRATGFILTAIKKNTEMIIMPDGEVIQAMSLHTTQGRRFPTVGNKTFYEITNGSASLPEFVKKTNAKIIVGYQLRYIYFIDKTYRQRLTCDELDYKLIQEMGAGMYKGKRRAISKDSVAAGNQPV